MFHNGPALAAALSLVLLTSCAVPGTSNAAHSLSPASSVPGASEGMPFDSIPTAEMDAIAGMLLDAQARCGADQGVSMSVDVRPSLGSTLTLAPDAFGPVTDAAARERGLHQGSVRVEVPPQASQHDSEVLDDCYVELVASLPEGTQELQDSGIQMVNDAHQAYMAGMMQTFADNNKDVAACAVEQGWTPANSSGDFDGRAYLSDYFGVQVGSMKAAGNVQTYQPTPEEIDLSITLTHCRQQLGIYDRSIAKAKSVQQEYVDAHSAEFIEYRQQIKKVLQAAQDVLT